MSVLVVGGSISGLFTSKFLLEGGVDVVLVDRKNDFGENIVCAGGIASYMIRKAGLSIPSEFIACKVKTVRFYDPTFDFAEVNLDKEYGVILHRDKWEKSLGEEVKGLGAKVYLRADATRMIRSGFDYIVGCDGLTGAVRRMLGLKPPAKEDVHVAIQALCRCRTVSDEAISLFFGSAVAEKGYGWAFPVGGSEFRVGLGVPLSASRRLMPSFRYLTSKINAEVLEKPRCKLIPTAHPMRSLVFKNVLLVGDAGLQTDPATGGGIGTAIIGARSAAEAIVKGDVKLYDRLWRRELYRRNRSRYALKLVLSELNDSEFSMLIDTLKGFKPISESIGVALTQLLLIIASRSPQFIMKHKMLRRLMKAL